MRVAPGFPGAAARRLPRSRRVRRLLPDFLQRSAKLREETGLTQGWWQDGALRVRHRIDADVTDLFPCFYGGGGSCAFDRRKFLELGGFDALLAPFYLEDTDLGYMAWKRGWKVLYQPRSIVYHEHRGTIGKKFPRGPDPGGAEEELPAVLLEEHPRMARGSASHFFFTWAGAVLSGAVRRRAGAAQSRGAVARLPPTAAGRALAMAGAQPRAQSSDTEAFRRPLGGYFRDRFDADASPAPERLRVLFVSPYPICPPVHGGGVFMYQTLRATGEAGRGPRRRAARLACAGEGQRGTARVLRLRRMAGAAAERRAARAWARCAARRRASSPISDLEWLIHRQIYTASRSTCCSWNTRRMAQYRGEFRRIAQRAVRARRLLPIDRPRPGTHAGAARRAQGAHGVSARAALRTARVARASTRCRSARRRIAITCCRSGRSSRRGCEPACAPASTPRATSSATAGASR